MRALLLAAIIALIPSALDADTRDRDLIAMALSQAGLSPGAEWRGWRIERLNVSAAGGDQFQITATVRKR